MDYIGIDLSQKASRLCVRDGQERIRAEATIATEAGALRSWLKSHSSGGRVVIEASALAEWLARVVESAGFEAVVVDARTAKRLMQARKKTDARDAATLSWMAYSGWYRAVHRKSEAARVLRSRLQARRGLLSAARGVQNQIRGLLRAHGVRLGRVSDGDFQAVVRERVTGEVAELAGTIEALLASWRELMKQKALLERELKHEARHHPEAKQLMAVPGVGPLTALTTVSTIDDPRRFGNAKQVGDYPGLAPSVYQSGEVDARGRTTREGDHLWRFHLVEAANALLTRGRDCALKRWGQRLAERKGGAKARVAVARKLAILLWRIMRDQSEFEPELAIA